MFGSLGYGCGYEGQDKGKVYFGVYTPQAEYGYVVENFKISLDSIYRKDYNLGKGK
jgi:hypothetical protein